MEKVMSLDDIMLCITIKLCVREELLWTAVGLDLIVII